MQTAPSPPHPPCHKHSPAFSVDTASVGIPTLYASSCSDPPLQHTHTHIRGPAIRPHTWACLQRKRPGRAALHAPVDWLHNVWPAVSLACPEPSLWGLNTQLGKACFPKTERAIEREKEREKKREGDREKTKRKVVKKKRNEESNNTYIYRFKSSVRYRCCFRETIASIYILVSYSLIKI